MAVDIYANMTTVYEPSANSQTRTTVATQYNIKQTMKNLHQHVRLRLFIHSFTIYISEKLL